MWQSRPTDARMFSRGMYVNTGSCSIEWQVGILPKGGCELRLQCCKTLVRPAIAVIALYNSTWLQTHTLWNVAHSLAAQTDCARCSAMVYGCSSQIEKHINEHVPNWAVCTGTRRTPCSLLWLSLYRMIKCKLLLLPCKLGIVAKTVSWTASGPLA